MEQSSEILQALAVLSTRVDSISARGEETSAALVELSRAMNNGFARVDERFDRLEVRVTAVESEVRAGFKRVDERLTSLEASSGRRRPS